MTPPRACRSAPAMAPSMNELEAGAYRASLEALAHADPEKPILQPDAAPADVKEWLGARGVQNALALVDRLRPRAFSSPFFFPD